MTSKKILTESFAKKIINFFLTNPTSHKRSELYSIVKKLNDPELLDKVKYIEKESEKWKTRLEKSTDDIIGQYNDTEYEKIFKLFKK